MTRDDIISMAKEAKLPYEYDTGRLLHLKELEHFAALIKERTHTNNKAKWYWEGVEAERERMKYDGIHTCHNECQRPACVATRRAVAREREECAKVCDEHWRFNGSASECADAIRARGQS